MTPREIESAVRKATEQVAATEEALTDAIESATVAKDRARKAKVSFKEARKQAKLAKAALRQAKKEVDTAAIIFTKLTARAMKAKKKAASNAKNQGRTKKPARASKRPDVTTERVASSARVRTQGRRRQPPTQKKARSKAKPHVHVPREMAAESESTATNGSKSALATRV